MSKEDIKFEVIKKIGDVNFKYKSLGKIDRLNSNSPPSVFIGSKLKYPLVNVGILSPLEKDDNAWLYDSEQYWADNNFEIKDVMQLRDSLVNSRFQSRVKDARLGTKFLNIAKEVALASRQVDIEIELKKRFGVREKKDGITTPRGINVALKNAKITSNVKVERQIDKVVNDDLKAQEGIEYLQD